MKTLHALLHIFTTDELAILRAGLEKEKSMNKSILLFDEMVGRKNPPSRQEMSTLLYNAPPDSRLTKLASRLEKRVLNLSVTDYFLKQCNRIPEDARARMQIRTDAIPFGLLIKLNGFGWYTRYNLQQLIAKAKKQGMVFLLLELYLQDRACNLINEKRFNELTRQIDFYRASLDTDMLLQSCFAEILRFNNRPSRISPNDRRQFITRLFRKISGVKKYIISYSSQRHFTYIQTEYLTCLGKFEGAKKILNAAINHNRRLKLDIAYEARLRCEYANCETQIGNYKSAVKWFEWCLEIFFKTEPFNYYLVLVYYFFPLFYLELLEKGEQVTAELSQAAELRPGDLRFKKYPLYSANIQFVRQNYKQVLLTLESVSIINKDINHDIAIRILRIQSFVMLEKFDEASVAVQSLRKQVSRYEKKSYLSPRDKTILKILVLAERRGFVGSVKKAERDQIHKLEQKKGDYAWQPLTNELIRFDEWYKQSPLSQ